MRKTLIHSKVLQSSGRDEQSLRHIAVVENFWISTNHGPAIEAKKKRKN